MGAQLFGAFCMCGQDWWKRLSLHGEYGQEGKDVPYLNNNKYYPSVPVDLTFSFSFLHSDIVFEALAITLE